MAIMKFKDNGQWKSIAAFKGEDGKDGAIQYQAGPGINISEDNIISATFSGENGVDITVDTQPTAGSNNPVASGGVFTALENKADKTEIPTDTGDLTNGAGYITSNDIPGDLGDFENEAGFITEESDPLFKASAAAGITTDNINEWNKVSGYTFVPLTFNLNFNTATVYNYNYSYSSSTYADKILRLAGSFSKAILCVVTASKSVILHFHRDYTTSSGTEVIEYLGLVPADEYNHHTLAKLKITRNQSTGAHVSTVFSTLGSSYATVTKTEVLTKTNTSSYAPTADYHPATKKYVDDQIAAGIDGIGGIETEEDPLFMNSVAASITADDIANWNNKADSGGVETETDPTVPAWVKSITEENINTWNNKAEVSDISGIVDGVLDGKGYLTEEAAFNNSVAAAITAADIAKWNNKQDVISFNTPYDVDNNKAATMEDLANTEAKIPTLTSQLKNDSGFLTSVNASAVVQDNNATMNEAQTKLTNIYTQLNTNAVVDGVVDYSKLIGNFDIRYNDLTGTMNGSATKYYSSMLGQIKSITHCDTKEYYAYALIGTTGYYDTCITFEPYLTEFDIRSTYVGISKYQFKLYVNEEDIINGVEGSYALERTVQSANLTRYT